MNIHSFLFNHPNFPFVLFGLSLMISAIIIAALVASEKIGDYVCANFSCRTVCYRRTMKVLDVIDRAILPLFACDIIILMTGTALLFI